MIIPVIGKDILILFRSIECTWYRFRIKEFLIWAPGQVFSPEVLQKKGARVTGVDISLEQIEAATALSAQADLNIEFYVSPAEDIEFKPYSFDTLNQLELLTFHKHNAALPFSRESWMGRIRACRGVGAFLSKEQVVEFDKEHAHLLSKIADEQFTILHEISVHVFKIA